MSVIALHRTVNLRAVKDTRKSWHPPVLDRIANAGLRYTQFHSTALCSPTRVALITGRNHHSVSTGIIGELSTGFTGYNTILPKGAATIGTILRENGYSTLHYRFSVEVARGCKSNR